MRIKCPYCGERSLEEYAYHGDAIVARPDSTDPDVMSRFISYVYERANPAGVHQELWYHAAGCHAWLVITRDTTNHKISSILLAQDVALQRGKGVAGDAQ